MKKLKQFISVFLCAVLTCSVFMTGVQAKTAKNYVKSISIKNKDTVTIRSDKKTATKSYKVTVKVSGKASKKFTAKSSNTAVATVKVSGTKAVVTAKKAGKANITVTTKAKSAKGKKLSKTLKLTVKKQKPASLLDDSIEITYSEYATPGIGFDSYDVSDIVCGKLDDMWYYATVADSSVAVTEMKGLFIRAKGAGTTTADIFEKDSDANSRKLGTITVKVKQATMAEVAGRAFFNDYDAPSSVWLKLNFGKTTFDYGTIVKRVLDSESGYGSLLTEEDYTATFKSKDENVLTVDEKGVYTGKSNGSTYAECYLEFKDGSNTEEFIEIKVTGAAIEKVDGYTIDNIRDYIVGVDTPVKLADGTEVPLINFDNAATTPSFKAVQDTVNKELEMYGSIGRGFSQKSNHSTDIYNKTRDKVLDFLGADPEFYTCFYVNTTTDGLNKLASALVEKKSDIVLTTRIEHHANDLSWRERCKVIYAEVDQKGRVIYDDIEKLLKENKVKIVSVSAASNVTGYVNDVHRVAKLAHKYGAKIVVDGAQIVAHRKFSMMGDLDDHDDNIDFIAFSAHKMYSPYGGGAVVGLTEELNKHMPTFYGGGTIKVVGDDWQVYKDAPAAYEAGSPNYPGVVGLGKAIDVLSTIGMDKIEAHEKVLNRKLIDGLKKLDNVILYGDSENIDDRVGVVTFNFSDINTYCLAQSLSELGGVATRRGAFCAHPYVWRLMGISDETAKSFETCTDANTAGMIRVSFGIYNNEEEVDQLLNLMPKAMKDAKEKNPHNLMKPEY